MQQRKEFKSLSLLALLTGTVMQISIIVAYKPVLFGSFLLPAGVIGFPIVFTLCDVIAEVYGYKFARKILWEAIVCCAFFSLTVSCIIRLPSPLSWHFQSAYNIVFGHILRIFLAVLLGIIASSFLNIYLISKWKIWLKGKYFWVRCFFSSIIAEMIITLIADVTGFLGTMPINEFIHMVLSVYLLKVIYSAIVTVPATYLVFFLKKYEDFDAYDYTTNFNPFSMKL